MLENGPEMAPRNVSHAAVFLGGWLQGHPDADLLVIDTGIVAVGFILMPRGRGADLCRFADRVFKPGLGVGPEQLPSDFQGVLAKLGFGEFRSELHGIEDLRKHRGLSGFVSSREIEGLSAFPTSFRGEEAIKDPAETLHFLRGGYRVEREIALLAELGELLGNKF